MSLLSIAQSQQKQGRLDDCIDRYDILTKFINRSTDISKSADGRFLLSYATVLRDAACIGEAGYRIASIEENIDLFNDSVSPILRKIFPIKQRSEND